MLVTNIIMVKSIDGTDEGTIEEMKGRRGYMDTQYPCDELVWESSLLPDGKRVKIIDGADGADGGTFL